jgi:hypothetical protein
MKRLAAASVVMPASLSFLGRAVLECAEHALRAAAGLGRVGRDVFDAEGKARPTCGGPVSSMAPPATPA